MNYKIIVLDLDGTLTNRDKVITPRTKQSLMEAQKRGIKVVLASGRNWNWRTMAVISCHSMEG